MIFRTAMITAIALTAACSSDPSESDKRAQAQEYFRTTNTVIPPNDKIITFPALPAPDHSRPLPNPDRNAYFGDLHVHTTLSFDASAFGTTASPADAYPTPKARRSSTPVALRYNWQNRWIFTLLPIMESFLA